MIHVLLDANVPLNMWLDAKGVRPVASESTLVMDAAAKGRITAYLTPTIFNNVFYFLSKEIGRSKAITLAADLLDQTSMVSQDEAVFRSAFTSGWTDIEDATQYFAAKAHPRITHLCTSNRRHYKAAIGIKLVSPAALLKRF